MAHRMGRHSVNSLYVYKEDFPLQVLRLYREKNHTVWLCLGSGCFLKKCYYLKCSSQHRKSLYFKNWQRHSCLEKGEEKVERGEERIEKKGERGGEGKKKRKERKEERRYSVALSLSMWAPRQPHIKETVDKRVERLQSQSQVMVIFSD